jgi:hypothetical protein
MIKPDRGFMKSLKLMDKRLSCVFRKEHEHFVITYDRGYGEPVNLHLVKRDDGGFRQPDNRDLQFISDGDMNNRRVQDRLQEVAKYLQDTRDHDAQKRKEFIRDKTKDDKIQLMSAFNMAHGAGKKTPAFRRI